MHDCTTRVFVQLLLRVWMMTSFSFEIQVHRSGDITWYLCAGWGMEWGFDHAYISHVRNKPSIYGGSARVANVSAHTTRDFIVACIHELSWQGVRRHRRVGSHRSKVRNTTLALWGGYRRD